MPDTPKPSPRLIENDNQARPGFKPSRLDIVIHKGTAINPNDPRINGAVVVRQGAFSIEVDIDTDDGIKTKSIDNVEAGDYFFEHLLFGFSDESVRGLRYRAQDRSVIMVLSKRQMFGNPEGVFEICGTMLRAKNREVDRLRQRVYNRQAPQEAEAEITDSLALTALKNASEELAQDLEAAALENRSLQDQLDRQTDELTRTRSALSEASEENQELWRYVRTLEGKALAQEKQITSLTGKISILECEDAKKAFRELTAEILRAQEATESAKRVERDAERRLNLMQRGFELLSSENPKIKMSVTVMLLLLGEEPTNLPPSPEFDARKTERDPSADELDQVFEDMSVSMPASSAKPLPERRPQGLSSRVTVPPQAKPSVDKQAAATMRAKPNSPISVPRPNPTVIRPPAARLPDRQGNKNVVPKPATTRDSMPEIFYGQEEANTDVRKLMREAGIPVRQPTLLDPYELGQSSPGFPDEEPQTAPASTSATQTAPPGDATADPNQTRTWGVAVIPKPEEAGDETSYEWVGDEDLWPQVTRPFDVSEYRRDEKNKKDGR